MATTGDTVEEEDWFSSSSIKKLMIETKNYQQQEAKSQPLQVISGKKSDQADTYLYHCHKLLRAPNCGINNSSNNRNNNNNDNREASTTIERQQLQDSKQDQVQFKMRLLVMNKNVDATLEEATRRSMQEASQFTFSKLSPESRKGEPVVCKLKQKQKDYNESSTSIHRGRSRFQVLAKRCQLMYGESNMIPSGAEVNCSRLSGRKVGDKSRRDYDERDGDIDRDQDGFSAIGEYLSVSRRENQLSSQRKLRSRQRERPKVRSIKLASTRYISGSIKMWPSWRQLVLLSFLSIMLTILLANLNIISPSPTSSCLLFNHCHALSMQQQASSSSNSFLEAAPGTKITHPNLSLSTSTIVSTSTSTPTESPPFIISSTTPVNLLKNTNTFVPTLKPRFSQLTPTTPNSSGASINAPTVSPASTTQSSNVAVSFVPASSQRLSPQSTLSLFSDKDKDKDKEKKYSTSMPTSLWSNKSKPTEQQLHKQQQQQQRYQQHAKQQQLTQLTEVDNPNKTTLATEFQQAHVQEFTTPASAEGGNNRQKFTFDNNYQNANNKKSKSSDMNNNGNFQTGAKISIKNDAESNSRESVLSSITRESHVEPQTISSNSRSNLLRATNSADELPDIVVGRQAQKQHPLTTSKVPTSSSSGAIKLIASPTLHVSESSTTPLSTQLNPSPSPFLSSVSQATINQAAEPTSSKSFQLGDGWSLTSDTSDSNITPNSPFNETSIRYNPGMPPADLYKAADSSSRASVIASGGGNSPAASPRQAEATQRNQLPFLVPAGGLSMPQNLFQSVINSALNDLINKEQLFRPASASSRPFVMRSQLHPVLYQSNLHQPLAANDRNSQLNNSNQPSKQTMAASASAPSISLPPLSHFFVPRNPFRLFSSSSSTNPTTTRYRPSFMVNKLTGKANNKQATGNKNEQQTNRWSNIGPHYASASNSFPRTPVAFQGSSTLAGLDDDNSNTNLYAHSHSAEQLERLLRAASQATGVSSPILPAIVSAPSGAFPGYYIPAIESESESQVSELRHGEPSSSISSKIPGTDYVLHPDEVRAMINIGEIAWRQRQQNEQGSHQAASSKSNLISFNQHQQQNPYLGQDSTVSETRGWQFGSRNHPQQGFVGYMQENHAENARDFAYVDPSNRRDQMQAHSSNNNDDHQQNGHQHQTRQAPMNSSELESHLMKHFHQKQLNSFPAIIRVNDQDYVHWPLIKMNQNEQSQANKHRNHPSHNFEESRKFSAILHPFQMSASPLQRPDQFFALSSQLNNQYRTPGLLQMPLVINGHQYQFPQQNMPHLTQENHIGWTPSASIVSPSIANNQKSPSTLHIDSLDNSPVRLATQLTPQEVRQVEDSIIEALIMNQSLQHQRNIMEGLIANQNQLRPTFVIPGQRINNMKWNDNNQKQNSGLKNGFFGRRKRRNSNNNNNNNNNNNINNNGQKEINHERIRQLLLTATASSPQLIGPIPIVNVSALPIHIVSPMLHYTDLPAHAIIGPAVVQPEEPLVLESRLAPKHKIPVLIADQETNRPNLLKPAGGQEAFSADSSAPKATILSPPSNRAVSDISFAESGRAHIHSDATFGSRVSRIKQNPRVAVTSGTSTPLDELFIEPGRTKLSVQPANSVTRSPSNIATEGKKLARENEPYSDRSPRSKQISLFSSVQSTSRPYRHVDWPTMVSDADYFPDSNGKPPDSPATLNSQQVQQAESRNLNQRDRHQSFLNNQAGNDNVHLSSSHVIRPSQSDKKYVTSQLKLQFAQDYQAREGVPIYNNNVRVAGALDRQRSSTNTVSSQRVPSEINISSNDEDFGNDDSDEADDESSDRDLQQKSSSDKKVSTPIQPVNNQEFIKPTAAATKLKQNTSRYERRPNSRGPQMGQSQLFD